MLNTLPEMIRVGLARVLLVVLAFSVIWLVRSGIAWLLAKPLKRLLNRTKQPNFDETIKRIISTPVNCLLLALGIDIGARILEVGPGGMGFVVNLTRTLIIIAITLTLYRIIEVLALSRRQLYLVTGLAVDEALLPFIRTGIRLVVLALMLVILIQVWGYDVSGLIAGLGLGGLAISLAAQDTLSNIFGFTAMVSDRPFVVGEFIKTSDVEGIVEKVGLRSTRIRQLDQALVAVPNSKLAAGAILNWSRLAKRRIDLTLGVTYTTSPAQMEELLSRLRTMLAERESVDPDTVVVYFIEFGGSSLNVLVRCYVNISDWVGFTAEKEKILLEIMRTVEGLGLQIAFPSRSLYIENLSSALNLSEQPLKDEADEPVEAAVAVSEDT